MIQGTDYLKVAGANEEVFRNVLRDLKNNKDKRPMGVFVPDDLETEASIEDIYKKYSEGKRMGKFTITEFSIDGKTAIIGFQDIAPLSGGGASLKYDVNEDKTVVYAGQEMVMMS